MTETQKNNPNAEMPAEDEQAEHGNSDGIIREMAELPPSTLITETGLAKLLNRHKVSIKRAVERGELPPPTRLLGEPVWTVRRINKHMEERLDVAKKEAEDIRKKLRSLSP